MLLVEKADLRK